MEDLQTIRGRILPHFKLNDLKALIKTINERVRPSPPLKISGNKKELNDRIDDLLLRSNEIGNQDTIRMIRQCIFYVQNGSRKFFRERVTHVVDAATRGHTVNNLCSIITSRLHHIRWHPCYHQSKFSQSNELVHGHVFKPSPFYKDIETLCSPRLCTEAKERTMNVTLQFTTTPTLAAKLKADPDLQIMIFCGWADTPPGQQLLMEFPSVCEVKVNQRNLEANLRGMKNKPGTVAPGNITRLCRLEPTGFNRIDFVYVNTTKKYNVSLHLVKRTSVESIIRGIQRGKFLSKERMLQIIADRNRDADVVVSASTLSLKCPLGFVRINIPCRSSYCSHLQCFDGYTFFNLNEQTPTWTCPVCSRAMLSWEEIVVDGYFTDILQNTPSSLESVTVQPDGKWEVPSSGKSGESRKATPAPELAKKKVPNDVFVLDDDDDVEEVDRGESADRRSPSQQAPAAPEPKQPEIEVIDLISDSEDEDGDAIMQAASHTLQEMANSKQNSAVKAEAVEPSAVATSISSATPVATAAASTGPEAPLPTAVTVTPSLPPAANAGVAVTTAAANTAVSATTEPSSRDSSERSPQSTASSVTTSEGHSRADSSANGWDAGDQEAFMNHLIGTNRRKRQYEVDNEMQNMTTEARQRISRMELHSRAGSERASSSAVQSPDAARQSTSSPSPATMDDSNSMRHVHQDRISNIIYDNLSAAAAAAVSPPSASSPEAMPTTSLSGYSTHPHASYSSQSQSHYRPRPPSSQHHQHPPQQHSSYSASSHSQSRPGSSTDYYSGYSRAPSTDHLRPPVSSVPISSSSVSSPPLHSSSSSSAMSGAAWSDSSMWRSGQDHPVSTSTWPSETSSRSTTTSNGLYATPSSVSGAAINPYAPRLSTLEELGRAAGLVGYSTSSPSSSSSSSSPYHSSSSTSNVTAHPQHSYQRHAPMAYVTSPASSSSPSGNGSRRGYDHRDASQTSPYAHRSGSSSGGYSHGRSHSGSSHGYPWPLQQQQHRHHDGQRRENGIVIDSLLSSSSQPSGYNGNSSSGGGGGDDDGHPHPQQHHRHHQHHSTTGSNGLQRQATDDLEEEEEVVDQGLHRLSTLVTAISVLCGLIVATAAQKGGGNINMGIVMQGGPDGTKEGTANAMALEGAKRACVWDLPQDAGYQYGHCVLHVYTPVSETLGAYQSLIPNKARENDFMAAMGYYPSKGIQTAASAHSNKLFAISNFEFTPPVSNIASILFSEDQIGFIAGLVAGEVAKTRGGYAAVIGGVDQPSTRRQVNGFGNGVKAACGSCQAFGFYAGTFDPNPSLSSKVAQALKNRKVSVVFNAASTFGTMTLKALTTTTNKDGQPIYAIGSGSDEWITNWAYGSVPGSEHVLTSIQTDYTVLMQSLFESVLRGNLTGGTNVFYGVAAGGEEAVSKSAIKLAPAHEASEVLTPALQNRMNKYFEDMAKGVLRTQVDHKSGQSRRSGANPTSVQLLKVDGMSASGAKGDQDGRLTGDDEEEGVQDQEGDEDDHDHSHVHDQQRDANMQNKPLSSALGLLGLLGRSIGYGMVVGVVATIMALWM
ncbi:SUMO ligase siz1 [Actinomortierella ambigua]|nr:SUMO ligase siz1 [Actinomortierella ambigua]